MLSRPNAIDHAAAAGQQYERAIGSLRSSGLLAGSGDIAAIELSLAAREASPAAQAIISLHASATASTPSPAACAESNWLSNGAAAGCAVDDVLSAGGLARLYPFDHVVGANGTAPAFVLYGDVGSDGFAALHDRMLELARSGRIRYVLRWRPSARASGDPHYLAGYGTGLDIKKADYLAIDDRPVETSGDAPVSQPRAAKDDAEATELVPLKASELSGALEPF